MSTAARSTPFSSTLVQYTASASPQRAWSPQASATVTPAACVEAGRDMDQIMRAHQEAIKSYFYSRALQRIFKEGAPLLLEGTRVQRIDPSMAQEILDRVDQLTHLLHCPLSRHPLRDPVRDPAVHTPPILAFERRALTDFYRVQHAFCKQQQCDAMVGTDLASPLAGTLPEEASLPDYPLVRDLIGWIKKHFPQAAREAPAEMELPRDFGTYTERLSQTYDLLEKLNHELRKERHAEQLALVVQGQQDFKAEQASRRKEYEEAAARSTAQLAKDLEALKSDFNGQIEALKQSSLSNEQKLAKQKELTEQYAAKVHEAEQNLHETGLKAAQLKGDLSIQRAILEVTKKEVAAVGEEQRLTERLLADERASRQFQLEQAAARQREKDAAIQRLQDRVDTLEERNSALQDKMRR